MTAPSRYQLTALAVAVLAWGRIAAAAADDDVTVISSSPSSSGSQTQTKKSATDSDGTPIVHKSSHKKKHAATETAATTPSAPSPNVSPTASTPTPAAPHPTVTSFGSTMPTHVQFPPVPSRPLPPTTITLPPGTTIPSRMVTTPESPASTSPAVETALPVARDNGIAASIPGAPLYQPSVVPTRTTYYASTLPLGLASATVANYSVPNRPPPAPLTDFSFASTGKRYHNLYPWKTYILTTEFWIGEGATPISSTDNVQSSWDQDWLYNNHGSDNPYNRNGYASGSHASTLNPFYCALPFNDLKYPDKARIWLPRGWYRPPRDGKQVSACQHRWVEIRNARGDVCYAQWEDVGPLRYDHAEYVFGDERPTGLGDDHAGLDVSPAVYDYLGLSDRNRFTSWRFVDDADVRPGAWLKLDEQAVLFRALQQMKSSSPSTAPIQRSSEPIEDGTLDANKKKVERAN